MKTRSWLLLFIGVLILLTSLAYAGEPKKGVIINTDSSERLFTISDIQKAKPHVNPLKPPKILDIEPDTDQSPDTPGVMTKAGILEDLECDDCGETRAFGSFGVPYTTTRVQDGPTSVSSNTTNRLSTTYPYRAIGKLTFNTPSGTSYCSASVIRRGVIVTAAHCIQKFGSGSTIYSNWQFTPGHYGATGATSVQKAPYGTWSWQALNRPWPWLKGTDKGSGSCRDNDLAVIILKKDSSGRMIGDRTGILSYGWNNYSFKSSSMTGNKNTAAISTLGYPACMDLGRIMQRTDGPAYTTIKYNAGQIYQGSNFTGGASGGPWIVNFHTVAPALSGGAVNGISSTMAVVGVTSWGASDPNAPKDNWSSQFRQNSAYPNANYGGYGAGNIACLLNEICNTKASGSSLTYKQLGYCN